MNGVGILFSPYIYKRREAKLDAPFTAYHNPFHTTIRTIPPPHHQASNHGFKLLFLPYSCPPSYLFKCNMTQNKLAIATAFQFSTFPKFHKFVSGHKWINCTSALSDWGLLFSWSEVKWSHSGVCRCRKEAKSTSLHKFFKGSKKEPGQQPDRRHHPGLRLVGTSSLLRNRQVFTFLEVLTGS